MAVAMSVKNLFPLIHLVQKRFTTIKRVLHHTNISNRIISSNTTNNNSTSSSVGIPAYRSGPLPIASNFRAHYIHTGTTNLVCDNRYSNLVLSNVSISSVDVSEGGKTCSVVWEDGFKSVFHSVWLRHNCHCDACRHTNGQRLQSAAHVSPDVMVERTHLLHDGSLEIHWKNGERHKGVLPPGYLRRHNYHDDTLTAIGQAVRMEPAVKEIPSVEYEEIKNCEKEHHRWLQQINDNGISLIKGVPRHLGIVKQVAEMIAPVMNTIYGEVFDVVTMDDPINVAYTPIHLDLHMDLVYFESVPGLQLLHCIEFSDTVQGGHSTFLDIFTVAEEFRTKYPDHFHTLTAIPATFHKVHYNRDNPVHLVSQKPHIKLNHNEEIVAIHWAPPFEGPLCVSGKDVEKYYAAYELFAKEIVTSPHFLEYRLSPGELFIFNNVRMLHGRTSFQGQGHRHLQGCYLNIDLFKNRVQVANHLVGDGSLVKRVGNQCWT